MDGRLWVHQSVPVRLLPDLLYCLQQKESVQHFVIFGVLAVIVGIVTFFWAKNEPADVNCLPDNMELDETVSTQEVVVDNEKYSDQKHSENKTPWLIVFGYGFLWMVLVGIISQFVPRMMSVDIRCRGTDIYVHYINYRNSGKLSLGWLDSKFGTKSISIVFAFSYVAALVLLITSFNIVCVWLGCVFAGLGIGGLLNLLASMIIDHTRIRIFGKPEAHVGRRMGVVLCYGEKGDDLNLLRDKAKRLAKTVLGTDPYMKK